MTETTSKDHGLHGYVMTKTEGSWPFMGMLWLYCTARHCTALWRYDDSPDPVILQKCISKSHTTRLLVTVIIRVIIQQYRFLISGKVYELCLCITMDGWIFFIVIQEGLLCPQFLIVHMDVFKDRYLCMIPTVCVFTPCILMGLKSGK